MAGYETTGQALFVLDGRYAIMHIGIMISFFSDQYARTREEDGL